MSCVITTKLTVCFCIFLLLPVEIFPVQCHCCEGQKLNDFQILLRELNKECPIMSLSASDSDTDRERYIDQYSPTLSYEHDECEGSSEPNASASEIEATTAGSTSSKGTKKRATNDGSSDEYSDEWEKPWKSKPKKQKLFLKKELKKVNNKRPRLFRSWSDADTREYRHGYPGKKDNPRLKQNYLFYTNQLESAPSGGLVDHIHKKWFGKYKLLEEHHGYIQWLFPIREKGMNFCSQELQLHEAQAIIKDKEAYERVLTSYRMMLDFYGMKLVDAETGKLERADNWRERYNNLNRSSHNFLRITRILKSLGELGYEKLKPPFVEFIMKEAFENNVLPRCRNSCVNYWVHVLRDDSEKERLLAYADNYRGDI